VRAIRFIAIDDAPLHIIFEQGRRLFICGLQSNMLALPESPGAVFDPVVNFSRVKCFTNFEICNISLYLRSTEVFTRKLWRLDRGPRNLCEGSINEIKNVIWLIYINEFCWISCYNNTNFQKKGNVAMDEIDRMLNYLRLDTHPLAGAFREIAVCRAVPKQEVVVSPNIDQPYIFFLVAGLLRGYLEDERG